MRRFLKLRNDHPRIAQVRQLRLFATLKPSELHVIDSLLHDRYYLKGEIVFDEGEEGQALYAVLSGQVLICRQRSPDVERIAEIEAGNVFGELALLDGAPRVAQARAATDCVLASLSRSDFNSLVETHAVIASKILLQLARELGARIRDRNPTRVDAS